MLGRKRERRTVQEMLTTAAGGRATVLAVRGAAGVGKSELVRYACSAGRARRPAFRTVCVGGDQFDRVLPLGGVTELVNELRTHVSDMVPVHRRVLSALLGDGEAETADVFVLGGALVALFAAAACRSRPMLVVVDDVHWLDVASVAALGFATQRLSADPVMVLLAGREIPAALVGRGGTIRLEGMEVHEARQVLDSAARSSVAAAVADRLVARAQGNPLVLREAARLLTPAQLDGSHPLPEPLPIGPDGRASIAPLMDRLSSRARLALLVAALAGQSSRIVLPAALTLLDLNISDLDLAIAHDIVVPDSWSFRHPLFAAAIYDCADQASIRAIHSILAGLWDGVDIPRWAHHVAAAAGGVDAVAAVAMEQAAVIEARRGGAGAACELWQRAVDLSPAGPGRVVRQLQAAEAQTLAGWREAAARNLHDVAGAPLSTEQLARVVRLRTALLVWSKDVLRDIRVISATCVNIAGDPDVAADASLNLAMAGFNIGVGEIVLTHTNRAVELSKTDPARNVVARVMHAFALSLFRGIAWQPEIEAFDDPDIRMYLITRMPVMCAGLAQVLIWMERPGTSDALRLPLIDHARRTGAVAILPYPLAVGGERSWWNGSWEDGKAQLDEAIELGTLVGQEGLLGFAAALQAQYAAAQGDRPELVNALARADHHAATFGAAVALYAGRARIHNALAHRRLAEAIDAGHATHSLATAIGVTGLLQVPYMPDYAEALIRGQDPAAADLLEELSSRAAATNSVWAHSVILRLKALSAPSAATALDLNNQALASLSAEQMPFEHARTLHCCAESQAQTGDTIGARASIQRAINVYTQLKAEPWRRQAAADLRTLGGRPTAPPRPSKGLSSQQARICDLITHGATNREAAAQLFLSEKTVEYHLSKAMTVLGATSRADLGRLFSEERQHR